MSSAIVDVSAFDDIHTPDFSDVIGDDEMLLIMQRIGNRTRHLADRIPGCGAAVQRRLALADAIASGFAMSGGLSGSSVDGGTGGWLRWHLDYPAGSRVIGATIYLVGAGAHAALPVGMPGFYLQSYEPDNTGFGVSEAGPVTDSSGTTGAYQTAHTITTSAWNVTLLADRDYYLILNGEYGTNELAGLSVYGGRVTIAR